MKINHDKTTHPDMTEWNYSLTDVLTIEKLKVAYQALGDGIPLLSEVRVALDSFLADFGLGG